MNFVVASLSSSSLHILLIIVLSQSYFVSGMEVCKSYYDHNDMYNKEVMCPRSCCGTCKNRYCCSSIFSSDRLDQTQCQVDVPISNIVFLVLLLICFCACCNKLHNRCKRRKLIATPPLGSPLSPQSLTVQNLNRQANSSPNDGVLIAVFTSSSAPPLPNSTAHYNCGTNLNRVEEESPPAYESIFK